MGVSRPVVRLEPLKGFLEIDLGVVDVPEHEQDLTDVRLGLQGLGMILTKHQLRILHGTRQRLLSCNDVLSQILDNTTAEDSLEGYGMTCTQPAFTRVLQHLVISLALFHQLGLGFRGAGHHGMHHLHAQFIAPDRQGLFTIGPEEACIPFGQLVDENLSILVLGHLEAIGHARLDRMQGHQ